MSSPMNPLKAARLRATIATGRELAERAELSTAQVYNLESGKTPVPTGATLVRLAQVLGIDPVDLEEDLRAWHAEHGPKAVAS